MARFAGTALTDYFSTPDFTQIGGTNMKGQSLQRGTATKAEGLVHGAGINSMAQVASAGFKADALEAQGAAQGQASMASGIGSMVSGIAGGFGARGTGGGNTPQIGVSRTSSGVGIPGSVAPMYNGQQNPYYGPSF